MCIVAQCWVDNVHEARHSVHEARHPDHWMSWLKQAALIPKSSPNLVRVMTTRGICRIVSGRLSWLSCFAESRENQGFRLHSISTSSSISAATSPTASHTQCTSPSRSLSRFISNEWKTSESATFASHNVPASVRQGTVLARDAVVAAKQRDIRSFQSQMLECDFSLSKAIRILCRAMIATVGSQQDTDQHLEVATGIHTHRKHSLQQLEATMLFYQKAVLFDALARKQQC